MANKKKSTAEYVPIGIRLERSVARRLRVHSADLMVPMSKVVEGLIHDLVGGPESASIEWSTGNE